MIVYIKTNVIKQSLETDIHIYDQLSFDKGTKAIQCLKTRPFNKWNIQLNIQLKQLDIYMQKEEIQSVPHTIQKIIQINHRLNFKT